MLYGPVSLTCTAALRLGWTTSSRRQGLPIFLSTECAGKRRQTRGKSHEARFLSLILFAVLAALCVRVEAQQPRAPRIAYLGSVPTRVNAFRQGLRELGYVEGRNIVIEWRSAQEKAERWRGVARDVVRLEVDLIVSGGGAPTTRAARDATATIPIVMAQDGDPVGSGFVASLARPGGNITGLSTLHPEISGKQLELLKEILPRLSRLAVLGISTRPGTLQQLTETERAGRMFAVNIQFLDVLSRNDVETAFQAAIKGRAEAVLVLGGPVFTAQRTRVVELAAKNRLPVVYPSPVFVEAGGLMTYSASRTDLHRRAATYVDKILKGAKPADLPVEQPTKFELIINLKTARQIGLEIPDSVLFQADKVIK